MIKYRQSILFLIFHTDHFKGIISEGYISVGIFFNEDISCSVRNLDAFIPIHQWEVPINNAIYVY